MPSGGGAIVDPYMPNAGDPGGVGVPPTPVPANWGTGVSVADPYPISPGALSQIYATGADGRAPAIPGFSLSPPPPAQTSRQLTLAQEQPANEKLTTPYYGLYTNSGDMNGAVPAVDGNQRVRLIDPHTGQVIVEGTGKAGAQQIATLANAVSQDLGRKAAWQVEYEFEPDKFTSVGTDRADPKHNLLSTIIRIAAPLLAAAIPGLGPVLAGALGIGGSGAALAAGLGGFAGTLATGGSLGQSLLAGATAGIGNSAGGALSSALRGAPVSFAGTNALGGVLGRAGDALSGTLTNASLTDLGLGALAPGYGGALTDAALQAGASTLGNTVAPLTITGGAAPGLTSALTAGAGTALGSALANGATAARPGQNDGTAPVTGTDVAPVTVTGTGPGGLPVPGLPGTPGAGGSQTTPTDQAQPATPSSNNGLTNTALDFLGQTAGGVGTDLGVFGLTQLLGLGPQAPGGGAVGDGAQTIPTPGYDGTPDVGTGTGPPPPSQGAVDNFIPPPPAAAGPGANTPQATGYGDAGGALGQALSTANIGGGAGTGAPLAAAPNLNVRGSTAPDIYPWRRRALAA